MNTNDQWFEPGDKVMRVSFNQPPGARNTPDAEMTPKYGQVCCVKHCFPGRHGYNIITFIGVKRPATINGWVASNFRRVEEIKLCVEAAAKMKQPKKSTVLVGDGEEEG